jgi:hypothetical protein
MDKLNIGLDVPAGGRVSIGEALLSLMEAGSEIMSWKVGQSKTEATLVAEVDRIAEEAAAKISGLLGQDCIAVRRSDGSGYLAGDKASVWGPFNSDYFIE